MTITYNFSIKVWKSEVREEYLQKILNAVTDEDEQDLLAILEKPKSGQVCMGRPITPDGYGDTALVLKYVKDPKDLYYATDKDYKTAKDFYEKKGYEVYHLREGLPIIFKQNQEIADLPDVTGRQFYKVWKEYFDEWIEYYCLFAKQHKSEELQSLTDALKYVLSKNTHQN